MLLAAICGFEKSHYCNAKNTRSIDLNIIRTFFRIDQYTRDIYANAVYEMNT